MEGRENHVSGKGGFDGDFGSFEVTDFSDQDDVGILTKKRAEGSSKVETDLFLHLHLVDSHEVEFNRVFCRHNICLNGIERLKCGIESVCLTATGWSGNEDHSVRLGNIALKLDQRVGLKSQLCHVEHEVLLVQETENDFFAKQGGQRRNTKVELTRTRVVFDFDLNATVLRQPFFRDVEFRHDLDA